MCTPVVFDASAFDVLHEADARSAGAQLRSWIGHGHGRIAYSTYGRAGSELQWDEKMRRLFEAYRQRGAAELIVGKRIQQETERLGSLETRSGPKDRQMLALTVASQARVMVVRDSKLRADFEDPELLSRLANFRRQAFPIERAPRDRNDFLHRRRCPRLRNP